MKRSNAMPGGDQAERLTTAEVVDRLRRFDGPPEQFLASLLAVQCQVGPARAGAILRAGPERGPERPDRPERPERGPEVLAVYPPLPVGAPAPVWLAQAGEACPHVMADGTPAVRPVHGPTDLYGQPARQSLVMIPLAGEQAARGLAAFLVDTADPQALADVCQRLELTAGLLSLYEMRLLLQRRQADLRRLRTSMETLAAAGAQDRFKGLAMALANEVATRWQAERVSIGFLKGRYVHLKATSHTEKFSRKMKLIQDLEAAMEECLDQDVEVLHPAPAEATYVARAAAELARHHGAGHVLSLPLRHAGEPVAVLTVERPADQPFALEEVEALRLACDLVTPRLVDLEEHDRWFGARLAGAVRNGAAAVIGPKHTWIKVAAIVAFGLLAFMIFGKGEYRVEAPFVFEPVLQRVVPAPFDGYLEAVYVEPADAVVGGETVLAELETADLRMQLAEAKAERASYLKQQAAAQRDSKIVEAQIAEAKAAQVAARIDLLEYKIGQARIVAPITGQVVSGDLKKRLGAPVQTGDVLFEVAPLEALRAELAVPEESIADLDVGQRGELATAAFPDVHFGFTVERINPVAEVADGKNVFKVRVRLERLDPRMLSGMEGVAKVDIGPERYLWIWTRPIVRWVRMKLWI
ncbi:MAG: HlyD family efflux transporter periplasmic adaptor subunit [Phycisphaerae bacterium]|nr:HlyD family efflux transporter periplasmic adaptor subunit [Phycisphaerae bacterium]